MWPAGQWYTAGALPSPRRRPVLAAIQVLISLIGPAIDSWRCLRLPSYVVLALPDVRSESRVESVTAEGEYQS